MRPLNLIKTYLPAILAAGLLAPLGLWLLAYSWPQHHLYYRDYRFDASEAQNLARYPPAMMAHGDNAWQNLSTDRASSFYRQAIAIDALYMDAWLMMAQIEVARGRLDRARRIVAFVYDISGHTSRWQPSIALLALELKMDATFRKSINFLVEHRLNLDDTLHLLDAHCNDANHCLKILDTANRNAYLRWLIRWDHFDDARIVWHRLCEDKTLEDEIILKYIDFLISKQYVDDAQAIWRKQTGNVGITNGGFENKLSGKGFDWRAAHNDRKLWHIQKIRGAGRKHSSGAQITFFGKANIDFYHLYQIIPVQPNTSYRLKYWWRGMRLNTDQGPFFDIVGYDCRDLYARGPMIFGTTEWREERIDFNSLSECHAVKIRLRRMPSSSLEGQIKGTLLLDDFTLEPLRNRADGR
jgi:hypothetical protein